jgi:hypothetical protein
LFPDRGRKLRAKDHRSVNSVNNPGDLRTETLLQARQESGVPTIYLPRKVFHGRYLD